MIFFVNLFNFSDFRNQTFEGDANVVFTEIPTLKSKKINITALVPNVQSQICVAILRHKRSIHSITKLNFLEIFKRAWIHILFMILAIILLYFLRRGDIMLEDNFTLAYVNLMTVITGGGTIRYRDKLEKIFFGFLFLGSFYINTICIDNLLYAEFLIETPDHVDSFAKLAQLNISIFKFNLEKDHSAIRSVRSDFFFNLSFVTLLYVITNWLYLFRANLGPDVDIRDVTPADLRQNKSLAMILPIRYISYLEDYMVPQGFVVDILPETLGKHFMMS